MQPLRKKGRLSTGLLTLSSLFYFVLKGSLNFFKIRFNRSKKDKGANSFFKYRGYQIGEFYTQTFKTMKKIVLISYYYPPCNYVPSSRVKSFVDSLNNKNYSVTVFTRHWTGDESTWLDFISNSRKQEITVENENNNEIYYLPFKETEYPKIKIFSKIVTLFKLLKGHLQAEVGLQHYDFIKAYCKKHNNEIKFILISSPPHNLIRIGYKIYKELDIPFIADFRDFENTRILDGIRGSLKNRLEYKLINYWIRKWVKKAHIISVINSELFNHFKKYNNNVIEIRNGFSSSYFSKMRSKVVKDTTRFQIGLIGTIYPQQDYKMLFQSVSKFLGKNKDTDIVVNLIGLKSIEAVSEQVANLLSHDPRVKITGRVSFELATEALLNSDILIYPAWKGSKGRYSTKIFEYLGSGNKILICPGDNDVIDKLILDSGNGFVANTIDDAFNYMNSEYQTKLVGKASLQENSNDQSTVQYSREYQNDLLITEIESSLTSA